MATLTQRILRRAVPVGVITAIIGYAKLWVNVYGDQTYTDVEAVQSDGPNWLGPMVFSFASMAALECVRGGET